MTKRQMETVLAIVGTIMVVIALSLSTAAAFDLGPWEDKGCTKTSTDGTSSLHVSARVMREVREHGWTVSDETGKLVCE